MSLKEAWEAVPTLHQCQYDDLVCKNDYVRVYRSRMTVADGMPADDCITVEIRTPDGA